MKFPAVVLALALIAAPACAADPHAAAKAPAAPSGPALSQSAKVVSVIQVPAYTYIEAAQGGKTVWLAATTISVKKGDSIQFDDGMVMNDFYSKGLKRTFPSILFVNKVVVAGTR